MRKFWKNKLIRAVLIETAALFIIATAYLCLYHLFADEALLMHLPSGSWIKRTVPFIVIFMGLYDLAIIFEKWVNENRLVIYGIILMAVFTSLPLFLAGLSLEQDLNYHLIRVQTIVEGLRTGQFPVRINSEWLGGYGYPSSIFYGDFLLYIPAFFEIVGYPLYQAFKIYVFIVNLLTAISAYICIKGITSDKWIGLAAAFVYCAAPYRMTWIYVAQFVGLYSGLIFLPIIALAIYKMYTEPLEDRKVRIKYATLLAVGMSGLICTHILTTLMTVFALFLTTLVLLKKTFTKNIVYTFLTAAGETLVLAAYFIVPFMDYYLTVPIAVRDKAGTLSVMGIQGSGNSLLQLFGYSINTHDAISRDINQNQIITRNSSIGLVLLFALIIAVGVLISRRHIADAENEKSIRVCVWMSLLFLWLSSCYFPWNYFANTIIIRVLAQVQFAWRYLAIAGTFLMMVLGLILRRCKKCKEDLKFGLLAKCICVIIGAVSVAFCCDYASDYCEGAFLYYFEDDSALEMYEIIGGEYLRAGSVSGKENLNHDLGLSDGVSAKIISQNGCRYEAYCENTTETEGYVDIPMFNYKGYHAFDINGNELPIVDGRNNVIRITIPSKYSGSVVTNFREPWYWRISEGLSFIGVLTLLMYVNGFFKKSSATRLS